MKIHSFECRYVIDYDFDDVQPRTVRAVVVFSSFRCSSIGILSTDIGMFAYIYSDPSDLFLFELGHVLIRIL